MKFVQLLSVAAAFALLHVATVRGGEVKIEGVHICCAQCVSGAQNILKDVAGVTDAKADQGSKSIVLVAADDNAAAAAIAALAKGGFRGTAKHGDKALAFPASNAAPGAKSDSVTIAGVHLCCPACYRAAEEALKGVGGVDSVTSDRQAKTLAVAGKGVDVNACIESLFKAGFQASVKN